MQPLDIAYAAGVFVLAGLVKGLVGLGLPTVAMGLLAIRLPPAEAAGLMLLPSFLTNLWQMAGPAFWPLTRRLGPLFAGAVAGTLAGSGWLAGGNGGAAAGLGVALFAYAGFGLSGLRLAAPRRHEGALSLAIGVATGMVTAATGVFVMPSVPWLQALGLAKEELVQALGLFFTVATLALALSLAGAGALGATTIGGSVLAVLPALAGMAIGQATRRRISEAKFRRWLFAALGALGLHLVLRAVM